MRPGDTAAADAIAARDAQAGPHGHRPLGQSVSAIVVDAHPVIRGGVRLLVEQAGVRVIGEAARLADAIELAGRHDPDLVILDADLPQSDPIAAIASLRSASSHSRVLLLASDQQPHRIRRALDNGADGYLRKSTTQAGLIAAVHDLTAGRRHVDPTLAAHLLHADPQPLSQREQEVLRLLARGHTNHELASTLFISPRTAETHRRNIMHKLGLTSRAEMVAYALRIGMLDPATP